MPPRKDEHCLRRRAWAVHLCRPLLALVAACHRLTVVGGERLPREGAALLVVKHRATRDSLLLSWILYRQTGRMASYLMKRGAAGLPPRLLEALGGVPVIRPQDVLRLKTRAQRRAHLEAARRLQQQALDYVARLYAHGELVVVYPEGAFYPYTLGPLQTGCLRHAYDLARRDDLDIPLIPIGLAYERPQGRRPQAIFRVGRACAPQAFPTFPDLLATLKTQLSALSAPPCLGATSIPPSRIDR
ncbi:MAG: 1-acyl-sn-glycerol-3-phosphate acyltransferase [Anaerolineae bacterium]